MKHSKKRDPNDWLPLTPMVLHVLLSLADGDKHGYAIIKEVRRRTGGEVELGASSLYAVLKRLLDGGLVVETDERPDPALDDERRRYYRLTGFGRDVAIAEWKRLESIVMQARAKRLVPRPGRAGRHGSSPVHVAAAGRVPRGARDRAGARVAR